MLLKYTLFKINLLPIFCVCLLTVEQTNGQNTDAQKNLKVFLDGLDNYDQYIKVHIAYIDYVRERLTADVHILAIPQSTASSGTQYTLNFYGQGRFSSKNDTLKYAVPPTATDDEIRQSLTQLIKLGLVQYQSHLPGFDKLSVVSTDEMAEQPGH